MLYRILTYRYLYYKKIELNLYYGENDEYFKKVKLSLLASVIILSSQRASALGSDPDDLEGNKIPISQPSSSRDCSKSAADLETQGETRIPKKELEDISGF